MGFHKNISNNEYAQNTIKFLIKVNHRKNINLNLAILENNYTFVLGKRLIHFLRILHMIKSRKLVKGSRLKSRKQCDGRIYGS